MTEKLPSHEVKPLPANLRFYDPRHWLLVLIWVFFRPSQLRQYLYCAPGKDRRWARGDSHLTSAVRLRTIASLLATALMATAVISLVLSVPQILTGMLISWTDVAFNVGSAVASGVVFGVGLAAFGISFGVDRDLAIATVVAGGVVIGVMGGWAGGALEGAARGLAGGIAVGAALGVAGGVARRVGLGVAAGVATGVVFGAVVGVEVGVAIGVAFGIGAMVGSVRLLFWIPEAVTSVIRLPHRSVGISRHSHPALWDELSVLPLPGTVTFVGSALARGTLDGLQVIRILLRNPFQRWAVRRAVIEWLTVADDPLGRFYDLLQQPELESPVFEPISVRQLRQGIRFRSVSSIDDLVVERFTVRQIRWNIISRSALLAEVTGRAVNYHNFGEKLGADEWMARQLTHSLERNHSEFPATLIEQYAGLLLTLEIIAAVGDLDQFARLTYARTYVQEKTLPRNIKRIVQSLRLHSDLPHAFELAEQWERIATALTTNDLQSLVDTDWTLEYADSPLVPEIADFLAALYDIADQLQVYLASTSPVRRNAALSQAVGMLQELEEAVAEVRLSERIPMRMIVATWQRLVGQTAGELGQQTVRDVALSSPRGTLSVAELTSDIWERGRILPFENPYVMGRPVQPPLFVGRRDLLSRIIEQWSAGVIPDSIILYGHRRMGKSSILRNLGEYAPVGSLVVYFDLKSARATVQQPGDLLFNLASAIFDEASKRWPDLAEPDQNSYTNPGAAVVQFRRLVGRVTELLPEHTFLVLALDEFEAIETAVETGQLTVQIYDWLRALSQTPRLALIMAGLHTLDEMSRNYQQAFFDSYRNEKVSFLTLEASTQLITRPTPDFSLDYDQEVVAEIHRLTAGQPLLIQRICSELVSHLNHQLFDLNLERSQRIGVDDLAAVLTDEFLVSESRYFDGIWRDQIAGYPEQQKVLQVMAYSESGLLMQQIAILSGLTEWATSDALSALQRRDLVIVDGGIWTIIMPLFKRWLQIDGRQVIDRNEASDEAQSGTRRV